MNEKEVIGTLLMENIQLKQRVGQLEEVVRQLHSQIQTPATETESDANA